MVTLSLSYFPGTVGAWKDEFTVNQSSDFDDKYNEKLLDYDIPFTYC